MTVALLLVGLLLITIPSALLIQRTAGRNGQQGAVERVNPTQLSAERDGFLRTYRRWEDLAATAQAAGLSLEGISEPVRSIRGMERLADTQASFRGLSGVLSAYVTILRDRLSAFTTAKSNALALLALARGMLQSSGQYRELRLAPFQSQLDGAARDLANVHMPNGFAPIEQRIRQTQAAIKTLLSAREAAYAELSATRVTLNSVKAIGADVTAHAAALEALAAELGKAGDENAFRSITSGLYGQRQALNALLVVPTPPPGPAVVTMAVPVYQQAMPLDCETSALRMGLAYYGRYYSDAQLFGGEPVDLRSPVMGANHTIVRWGNPYTYFVGNVWGAAATPTGYGVYYPVIVNVARSHGLPNTLGGEGYTAATIYAALKARHPVEVWVDYQWTPHQTGVWTAWDGTKVRYSYGEHAVTLTGVSATQVRVNDPAHGTQYWISKATFETYWRTFNNMAVIFK